MPTENKTTNLNLNSWLGTDKPKREDFVNDNLILDSVISSHINNAITHISAEDRADFLSRPFVLDILTGTGAATKSHTLSITPKMVIVFLTNGTPITDFDSTNNRIICNSGIGYAENYGGTAGIDLFGNTLILSQSQSLTGTGPFINLNKLGEQYLCVAFK